MKKAIVLLLILATLAGAGCYNEFESSYDIPVVVDDNGIATWTGTLEITMDPGDEVDITYFVYNKSGDAIAPSAYLNTDVNPKDYEMSQNYAPPPADLVQWITIDNPNRYDSLLEPEMSCRCNITLNVPRGIDLDNFAFRTGVTGGAGGFTQTAVETWWLITLR